MSEKSKNESKEEKAKAATTPKSGKATSEKKEVKARLAKPPKEPEKPMVASNTDDSAGVPGLFWVLLLLAGLAGGGYATMPLWSPYVIDYLPGWQKVGEPDIQENPLVNRLDQIEKEIERVRDTGEGIADLERERSRLSQSIDGIMERIHGLESQIDDVRGLLQATVPPSDDAENAEALALLKSRMSQLEKSDETAGAVLERLAKLEQTVSESETGETDVTDELSKAMGEITARVGSLESDVTQSAAEKAAREAKTERQMRAQALLMAVGQLRERLRSSDPFAGDLEALKTLGMGDPDIVRDVDTLAPFAENGVPSVDMLRRDFKTVVEMIHAASPKATTESGAGIFDQALAQVQSLVSIRKTGSAEEDDGSGGIAETAMAWLNEGDLEAATAALASLTGDEAQAAKTWLARAQSRLMAEAAVARLNVFIVSQLSSAHQ